MKAIINGQKLCVVVEDTGDGVVLEPFLGSHHDRFWLPITNASLLLDPTDDEVDDLKRVYDY